MSIPKLLRAIASGRQAQENWHDVIFNAAADQIDEAAAFLDKMAKGLDATVEAPDWRFNANSADECRAMAAKLRGGK